MSNTSGNWSRYPARSGSSVRVEPPPRHTADITVAEAMDGGSLAMCVIHNRTGSRTRYWIIGAGAHEALLIDGNTRAGHAVGVPTDGTVKVRVDDPTGEILAEAEVGSQAKESA